VKPKCRPQIDPDFQIFELQGDLVQKEKGSFPIKIGQSTLTEIREMSIIKPIPFLLLENRFDHLDKS
jgi:hypothetical protein